MAYLVAFLGIHFALIGSVENTKVQLKNFYGLVSAYRWNEFGKALSFKLFGDDEDEYFLENGGAAKDFSEFEKCWVFVRGHFVGPNYIEVYSMHRAIQKKRGFK